MAFRCCGGRPCGNTNTADFCVTVVDTQAPQIVCAGNMTLLKTRSDGADLLYQLLVSDAGDTNVMVQYSIPPGGTVGPGTTTVTCAVVDASGNRNTCSFDVHVINADPGLITGLAADHQGVRFTVPTQAGVRYPIQYKDSLNDRDWQPLGTIRGDGTVMLIQDPYPSETMCFYRACAP